MSRGNWAPYHAHLFQNPFCPILLFYFKEGNSRKQFILSLARSWMITEATFSEVVFRTQHRIIAPALFGLIDKAGVIFKKLTFHSLVLEFGLGGCGRYPCCWLFLNSFNFNDFENVRMPAEDLALDFDCV